MAVGSSIPEFTTNFVGATKENVNYNIGIGNISGSASYGKIRFIILDFTILFGIASLFIQSEGLHLNKMLYYKDSLVYLFSLTIVIFFLRDSKISIFEAVFLILLFPSYIIISSYSHINEDEQQQRDSVSRFNKPKIIEVDQNDRDVFENRIEYILI